MLMLSHTLLRSIVLSLVHVCLGYAVLCIATLDYATYIEHTDDGYILMLSHVLRLLAVLDRVMLFLDMLPFEYVLL